MRIMNLISKSPVLLAVTATMFSIFCPIRVSAQVDEPITFDLTSMYGNTRLGIDLSISGSTNEMYLLDTGSSPFTTSWILGAPWWTNASEADINSTNTYLQYGPGSGENQYYYYPATDSVSITGSSASNSLSASIPIAGEYSHYTNANGASSSNADWVIDSSFSAGISNAVTSNIPPNQGFFGILGADLVNSNVGLFSMLNAQTYGTNVVKGFILNGATNSPTLTIAPSASTVQGFTTIYQMNTNADGSIRQALISPSYNLTITNIFTGHTTITNIGSISTLLDSGTPPSNGFSSPGIFITQGSNLNLTNYITEISGTNYLKDGDSITALIGDTPYTLTSELGDLIPVFGSPSDTNLGVITFGLNFFENYSVLYNLSNDTVGIQQVPEPSSDILFGLGILALAVGWKYKFSGSGSV